ncbi:MAG: translation initiation factor IF-2 subunit beta [Nanobdellota archaeon]
MDYEEMLKKGREELPDSIHEAERFEIPKVKGHIQGNKTVLSNFSEIASTLGRDPQHMFKFILKELATPGNMKKTGEVIMGSKIPASKINDKIKLYSRQFVICPECGKPDTNIEKEKNIQFLKCTACGAKTPIHSKI